MKHFNSTSLTQNLFVLKMQGMFKTSISALEREHSDNKRIMFLNKKNKT